MSTSPVAPTPASGTTSGASSSSIVSAKSAATDQTMFLQLLVSELKNQDPMNPVQGTDFVTQLAQMQQLSQSVTSGQDIAAMHTDLDQIAAAFNNSGTTAGTTGS